MNFKKLWVLVILTMIGVGVIVAPASGADKLVMIATITGYSPYCFDQENAVTAPEEIIAPGSDSQQLQGYSWDVVRESFHAMGYTIKLLIVPGAKCLDYAEKGRVDVIFPAGKSAEREEIFLFPQEPVNETNYVVYIPADSSFEWKGIESVNGLRITVMRNWTYGDQWEANKEIVRVQVDDILQGFLLLDKQRVFGVAGYEIPWDYALKTAGLTGKYKKLPSFDVNFEYLIGSKNLPQVSTILNDFDAGKKQIIANGVFDQITQKWQ